ncbi:MAG: hypothetical protein KF804_05360 [Burkholderiales bacterium]|jgi:hypothetical protein|nr:hypothetical protein [Burkholderiales bacterium]
MDAELALRILSLCVLLAAAETLHGIVRAAVLVPRIGKKPALKVAIVSGSLLAFALCWWRVPPMGVTATLPLFGIGFVLALFMAAFDILLGRWLLKRPWSRAFEDFNPATGNYLVFGILLLVFFPWIAVRLHAA